MNKELMTSLVGKVLKVNRGGPESRMGKLLYGGDDHFALLTEKDGVVYYNSAHVKSISQNSKSGMPDNASEEVLEFMKEDTLGALLTSLQYQWVKINRGGPEKLEGVLDNSNEDYITLVLNEEVIRLATFHVKSISYVANEKKEGSSDQKEDSKKEDNSKQKEESKKESTSNEKTKEQSSKKSSTKKANKKQPSSLYLDEIEGAQSGSESN
ncbi:hypothetical protein [Bacillus sp. BHET2]|uniref:hypothetical protein n=1 Tax=Bacillus sp. BHET2 TaxID=2583818 RepID=UPI00196B88E1|nr:hypothetical protein [Bacillus sp. BHET2]